MTSAIEIRNLPVQRPLIKKVTCSHADIGPSFARTISSVGRCLRAGGAQMASAPLAVYLAWRESDCDMAVGCNVQGDVPLSEGCEWLDIPAGKCAVASHLGPYQSLAETHTAIRNWCSANHFKMIGPCWETYPVDPGAEPDPAKWQTDVHYPVSR